MLAGCSTLSSPRHSLRSEGSAQFPVCHFKLPSMSTQRLDLPCSLHRKDAPRSQLIRAVSLSVEKPIEAKGSCSIRQKICLSPSITATQTTISEGRRDATEGFWEEEENLKWFSEQRSLDESSINKAKRKRCNNSTTMPNVDELGVSEKFWFPQNVEIPHSMSGITILDPPLAVPLLSNPWVESVVNEITDRGDNDVGKSQGPKNAKSGPSTSSDSRGLTLRPDKNFPENETGNGHVTPEFQGFELVSLLVACVESISSNDVSAITHFLSRLGELASPEGTPIHRVIAYFTEALSLRVARLWPHIFHVAIPREIDRADEEMGTSLWLLNHMSPIPKFLHFTSNEMLLRAFEGESRVHIIDFDIKQGLQWPSLFQSLASRSNPPSHVRITGIGESRQELQETGERLQGFAAALNLPFKFHAVVDRLEDVRLWMLHVKENESVAVNCILQLHKMLYDESGGVLRDFLGLIRSTKPTIVLMAEQEAKHDDASLETRVSNSLKYYSTVFDSIDSSLVFDSPVRIKVEEMFVREIRNIVACEGSDRFERHQVFTKWRKLMEDGGFKCVAIGDREMVQSQILLKMYSCEKFSLEKQGKDGAGLTLTWQDQPLYTVSAWAPPINVTGKLISTP